VHFGLSFSSFYCLLHGETLFYLTYKGIIYWGAYEKKGMLDEALSEFKQAIALDPDYARAHYNLATVYAEKERWDEAIREYTRAIELKPDYADTHNNLAVAYGVKGNHTLAIFHCDKAIALGYKVDPRLKQFLKAYR
jgi:tetratricopeptide (TPR) repeat protein